MFYRLDSFFVRTLYRLSLPFLRLSLGGVFLWFGILKVIGASPVFDMVTGMFPLTPPWFQAALVSPERFFLVLGVWEIAVGVGLIVNRFLRITLLLLWIQMAATFAALYLAPELFFADGSFFHLTFAGEFVVKNIVLVAAGVAIGGLGIRWKE